MEMAESKKSRALLILVCLIVAFIVVVMFTAAERTNAKDRFFSSSLSYFTACTTQERI
jgi:CHASE3 domain sensor protein